MDFLRRSVSDQPQATRTNGYSHAAQSAAAEPEKHKKTSGDARLPQWLRVAFVVLFASLAIMVIGLASLFYVGKNKQAALVNTKEVQAVFLTNGQVYFGNITGLNSQYFELQNIFYLNSSSTSSTTSQANLSLVKLGCELHGPEDQMVINATQVSFWENLKSNGKVAQAISTWKTQNPSGQQCSTTTNSTQQSTPAATGTPTTPTSTTK